ncbi:Uncharacterised protein [Mycobacterium tuberculosis]|nr:Uncharacterised protein [Mycobacterium tuberculosis]
MSSRRDRTRRADQLLALTEEVVDVVQASVPDEQHVPAMGAAVLEQHALGAGGIDGHIGQHGERAPANLYGRADADVSAVGIVDVAGSFADQVRPRPSHRFQEVQIGQRQPVVLGGFGEPQRLELLKFVGMLGGQVVALAAVCCDVEQFPAVSVEIRPAGGRGRVNGVGEPTFMPDPAGAQHGVELGGLAGVGGRGGKGRYEAHAVHRFLRNPLDGPRRCHAQQVVDGGRDVADIDVVVADFTVCGNAVGPGDDCRVGNAAFMRGVALEQLVGGVEGHCPPDGVVVVGLRATEVVEELHAFSDGVDVAVEELAFVDRSVGSALAAGAVVGDHHDDGVVQLAGFLEVVQDPSDLGVGVAQKAGEHLGHPAKQLLFFIAQRVPRPHRVLQRPGLAVWPRHIQIRVYGRQFGVGWHDP